MEDSQVFHAEDIELDDPVAQVTNENFGIPYLYPWQRLVIGNVLDFYELRSVSQANAQVAGSGLLNQAQANSPNATIPSEEPDCTGNQIVLLPTGAGKSLCFQVPALMLPGVTLVIYPLLALMSDQVRRMTDSGIKVAVFRGGQRDAERQEQFSLIEKGAKIAIANPEVLASSSLVERLCSYNICHVAIDEAHCVSEWGDTFRPAYLELGKILQKIKSPVVTAFTATASPEVLARISDVLFDGQAQVVRSESDRPNIRYYVKNVASKKTAALLLARTQSLPMIIFCGTRSRAEDMAQELNTAFGYGTAKFYHAGLSREEKTETEQWFFDRTDVVLCATCAYGMGVDKKNIRTVVHLDVPSTAESYIQEAGRGGRDGKVSDSFLLWSQEDRVRIASQARNSRIMTMRRFAEDSDCRRQTLLDALGAEQAVCSGCDLCDEKELFPKKKRALREKSFFNLIFAHNPQRHGAFGQSPGRAILNDMEILFKLIRFGNNYFTEESLEKAFVSIMNAHSRHYTGLNLWGHDSFMQVYEALLSRHLIRKRGILWNKRITVTKRRLLFGRFFRLGRLWCWRRSRSGSFLFLRLSRLFPIVRHIRAEFHA